MLSERSREWGAVDDEDDDEETDDGFVDASSFPDAEEKDSVV